MKDLMELLHMKKNSDGISVENSCIHNFKNVFFYFKPIPSTQGIFSLINVCPLTASMSLLMDRSGKDRQFRKDSGMDLI